MVLQGLGCVVGSPAPRMLKYWVNNIWCLKLYIMTQRMLFSVLDSKILTCIPKQKSFIVTLMAWGGTGGSMVGLYHAGICFHFSASLLLLSYTTLLHD